MRHVRSFMTSNRGVFGFLLMSASVSNSADAFSAVRIYGSGIASVNTKYEWRSSNLIPEGFARVCVQNQWDVETTWAQLNGGRNWLHASNDAYIYLNSMDDQWWIDEPSGRGVFVAPHQKVLSSLNNDFLPPMNGWRALEQGNSPLPNVELIR